MWLSIKAIWRILAVLVSICFSLPIYAQAITVNPDSLAAEVKEQVVNSNAFIVNGAFTRGLTPEMAATMYKLGPLSRTLVSLTTLRMHAAGLLELDEDVAKVLPDILDENPFQVAITPRHLLTETTGFAVPPVLTADVELARYATLLRTAGQMAHADAVGWAVLVRFLEKKGNSGFADLAQTYVLAPLALPKTSLEIPDNAAALAAAHEMLGSGALIAELARLAVRNKGAEPGRFLPPDLYEQFTDRAAWRMHPVGPRRTLGGVMHDMGARNYISPAPMNKREGPNFIAFPDQGIAFVTLTEATATHIAAIKAIAADRFLPPRADTRLTETNGLYDKNILFNGLYVRADTPSAWLANKLKALESDTLTLTDTGKGTLVLHRDSGETLYFTKKAPYLFEAPLDGRLILSPYRQGGYLVLKNTLYRYVGVLGKKSFVLDFFPILMLTLLSSGLYIRSKTSPRWRKMGLYGVLGTLMITAGLVGEYVFWPQAVFVWDMPWLVNLWRIILNAGLALVLSLPLFAVAFTKKNEMPTGATIFIAPLHLALISVSAIALFLTLVAWGVAGEFSAY